MGRKKEQGSKRHVFAFRNVSAFRKQKNRLLPLTYIFGTVRGSQHFFIGLSGGKRSDPRRRRSQTHQAGGGRWGLRAVLLTGLVLPASPFTLTDLQPAIC